MHPISKFIGILSCSFLLSMSLSNVASSADELNTHPSAKKISDSIGDSKPGKTIKGEVVRVEGDNYVVRQEDGKEMRMHVDNTTKKDLQKAKLGDHVMAKVDDQGHAISFLTNQPMAR